jgi:hypothetical protein
MPKNPFVNALLATTYIVVVSSVMYYGPKPNGGDDTVAAPIAALSLLTLSAAIMGYLFLFQPLQLYLTGKRQEAVTLFLRTVLIFAGFTALALVLLFSGIISP